MTDKIELRRCPLTYLPIVDGTARQSFKNYNQCSYRLEYQGTEYWLGLCTTLFLHLHKNETNVISKEESQKYLPIFMEVLSRENFHELFNKTIHWNCSIQSNHQDKHIVIKDFVDRFLEEGYEVPSTDKKTRTILQYLQQVQSYDGEKVNIANDLKIWTSSFMQNPNALAFYLKNMSREGLVDLMGSRVGLTMKGIKYLDKSSEFDEVDIIEPDISVASNQVDSNPIVTPSESQDSDNFFVQIFNLFRHPLLAGLTFLAVGYFIYLPLSNYIYQSSNSEVISENPAKDSTDIYKGLNKSNWIEYDTIEFGMFEHKQAILDNNLFLEKEFTELIFGGVNFDLVQIGVRNENGENLETKYDPISKKITLPFYENPYIEFSYQGYFYKLEQKLAGSSYDAEGRPVLLYKCLLSPIEVPTMRLSALDELRSIDVPYDK